MKLVVDIIVGILHWLIGEKPIHEDPKRELKISGGIVVVTMTVFFTILIWQYYSILSLVYAILFLLTLRSIIVYRVFLYKALMWLLSLPAKYMAWVGGYDWSTLLTLNKGQKVKAVAVGCLVHIPVLWGIGAIGFTLSDGLKLQQPAISIGTILYGMIILFLERGLIISLRRKRQYIQAHTAPAYEKQKLNWLKLKFETVNVPEKNVPDSEKWVMNYWGLIPRIALAIAIAYFDSLPLELRYFKAEIKEELAAQKIAEFERIDSIMRVQISEKDSIINQKRLKVDAANQALMDEMNGKPGLSQGTGYGTNAKRKDAQLQEITREYMAEKAILQAEKDSIIAKYKAQKKSFDKNQADGIGAQYEALKRAGEKKPIIGFWEWVLRVVSIFIQLVPAIIKIILPVDSYERTLAKMEEEEENEMSQSLLQSRSNLEKEKSKIESDLYVADRQNQKARIIIDAEVEATKDAATKIPAPMAPTMKAKVDDMLQVCAAIQQLQTEADALDEGNPTKSVLHKIADDALTKLISKELIE